MKLISLNISDIKTVEWQGRSITTGIFKEPTSSRLQVTGVNIVGDDQADRSVHGGYYKAVYGYPMEHYSYWRKLYPHKKLDYGMFGENITTLGLLEDELFIGDEILIGTAILKVAGPRVPCFKLGIKFGTNKVIKQFTHSDKPGFYFSILQEGEIGAGDQIEFVKRDTQEITVLELLRYYYNDLDLNNEDDLMLLKKIGQHESVNPNIRDRVQDILNSYNNYLSM